MRNPRRVPGPCEAGGGYEVQDRARERQRRVERAKYDREYFHEHYWAEDLPGKRGNRDLSYDDPSHHGRFEFLAAQLVECLSFHTVLDAGCGTGLLLPRLGARGKDATGIDVSCDAGVICRQQTLPRSPYRPLADCERMPEVVAKPKLQAPPRFVVGALERLPFRDGSFDLVWCSDVMEHVPMFDIEESIRELIRVTRTHLVLTINLDNPYRFHPTILSRESWDTLFLGSGLLAKDESARTRLQESLRERYVEYDVFAYRRIHEAED